MGPNVSQEAQRVFEAIDALQEIADPTERAREVGIVLANLPDRNKQLRQLRRAAVLELLTHDGATYRSVGNELGIHFTTIQAIVKEHTSSGKVKPKSRAEKAPE
jgi:uncharacterized protein YerC